MVAIFGKVKKHCPVGTVHCPHRTVFLVSQKHCPVGTVHCPHRTVFLDFSEKYAHGADSWAIRVKNIPQAASTGKTLGIDPVLRADAICGIERSRRVDVEKLQCILSFSRVGA